MKSIYLPHYDLNKIARGPVLKDNGRYYVNIRHLDQDFAYAYITNINVGKSIKFTAKIKISNSLQEKFRNYNLL